MATNTTYLHATPSSRRKAAEIKVDKSDSWEDSFTLSIVLGNESDVTIFLNRELVQEISNKCAEALAPIQPTINDIKRMHEESEATA